MNIYEKLQNCRVDLQNLKLKKGGKNKFANFDYYELADFIPAVNELFKKYKLCSTFNITTNVETGNLVDIATLTIINVEAPEEKETFISPTADASIKGCTPIQSLGGVHTYMKRYLYLNALEIVEPDLLDSLVGADKKEDKAEDKKPTYAKKEPPKNNTQGEKVALATKEQLEILNRQDEPVKAFALKKFNVASLEGLTKENADYIINSMKEKGSLK